MLPLSEASIAEEIIIGVIDESCVLIFALTTIFTLLRVYPPAILDSPLSFGSKHVYHLLPSLTVTSIEVLSSVYILTVCGVVPVISPT